MTSRQEKPTKVHVAVPATAEGGYDVHIRAGALAELPAIVSAAAPAAAYAIIAPDDVAAIYGDSIRTALNAAGMRVELLTFPRGEAHKTRVTWETLTDGLLARGFGRDSCIIALGGGVAGDIAGFVGATYMRGIPVIQVPTTLLAMIDASVGGKTGVDTEAGKNLVGAFHAPRAVIIDPLVLRTLPGRELCAGLAEAVKHGAILDAAYFARIEADADALLALQPDAIIWLIKRSVELKAGVVAQDPHERDVRAILNFGHTVAHALETQARYALPHGFAVAIGMVAEAAIGEAVHVTERGTAARLAALLLRLDLPVRADADLGDLLQLMTIDKKARAAQPRFVLLQRIGTTARNADGGWTHRVSTAILADALRQTMSAHFV